MLREYEKIFVFVTHDPHIALLSGCRIVMNSGAMRNGRAVMTGCPLTHVGVVVEEPDYQNGDRLVHRLPSRRAERSREIGYYHILAYEGIVKHTRQELQIGQRYFSFPRMCMLQSRHSGLVSALAKREAGMRVRVEGIWIS